MTKLKLNEANAQCGGEKKFASTNVSVNRGSARSINGLALRVDFNDIMRFCLED